MTARRTKTATVAAVAALLLAGCGSLANTDPSQRALVYEKGPFSAKKFIACVDPSTRKRFGVEDQVFFYPAGQRTYRFGVGEDADHEAMTVVAGNAAEGNLLPMTVTGVATFNLTADCESLQKFHEQIGLKYGADFPEDKTTDGGWENMLDTYVGQALEKALDRGSKGFSPQDLYGGTEGKTEEWEIKTAELAEQYVEDNAGEAYFAGFRVNLQQPDPGANVRAALEDLAAAKEQVNAQAERNNLTRDEAAGLAPMVALLGQENALLWSAIQKGQVSVVPVPVGGAVNITPPQ